MSSRKAPYGTWTSPITSDALIQKNVPLLDVLVDPITDKVYHLERRSAEGGRAVVVDTSTGEDIIDKEWNATSRVYEYGGASAIVRDGVLYFSHAPDGRVYRQTVGSADAPSPVTPSDVPYRYADFTFHPTRPSLLVVILEDHTTDTPTGVLNRLTVIDTDKQTATTLVEGADFYAAPRFSPDGRHLAYQVWNHPDMAWQRSTLHVARVRVGSDGALILEDNERIAWDDREVVVGFPQWIDEETLLFISDDTGYLNPRTYSVSSKTHTALLTSPLTQDFGGIPWQLGSSSYAILRSSDGTGKAESVLLSAFHQGRQILYLFDLASKTLVPVESPFVEIVFVRATGPVSVVFIATSTTSPQAVVSLTLQPSSSHPEIIHTTHRVLKSSMVSSPFPSGIISQPLPLTLDFDGEPVHVVLYLPTNPAYDGSDVDTEKPPCIVNAHSGPTSYAGQGLNWEKQYYTSRGWAWLDVNYGGSSGYGRKYADRLYGTWGITDVGDVARAVNQLASEPHQLIDGARTAVRGSSSGGYTALAALCAFPRTFAAGASLYGISDLRGLTEGSHKFEHKYMDKLLGGSYAEIPEVYAARSPVNNAERIGCPLLILQGLEDRVVPPAQAEVIVAKVRAQGGQVDYVAFEGESHGWKKAETIKRALEAERGFYERVFGIAGAA